MKRDLSLSLREENKREIRKPQIPVHFSKDEIKKHFDDSLYKINEQFKMADSMLESGNVEGCNLVLRSQVVFAEGLLDFYIHEVSKYCLFQMFSGGWEKSPKYESILVPMKRVEEAISKVESNEWFFEYINEIYSRVVFLSFESMRDQLNLIGVGFSEVMKKAFPGGKEKESIDYGRKVVSQLFARRNKIAHQNDRSHLDAVEDDIDKEFVEDYLNKIVSIVDAIHSVVTEKDEMYY